MSGHSLSHESFLVCRKSPPVNSGRLSNEDGCYPGQGFGEHIEEVELGNSRAGRRPVEMSGGKSGEHDALVNGLGTLLDWARISFAEQCSSKNLTGFRNFQQSPSLFMYNVLYSAVYTYFNAYVVKSK